MTVSKLGYFSCGYTTYDQLLLLILDGNDEAYNIYDKPWRSENTLSNHLYRPPKNRDNELYGDDIENIAKQKRFVPDKGFEGADASAGRGSGPVQFEKDAEDIFGIDKLLTDAKRVSFSVNLKRPGKGPKLPFDHCLPKSITDLEPEMGSHNNFRVPNDLAKKIKVKNLKEEKITINCHLSYPKGSVDRSNFCFGPWNSGHPTRIILCPNDLTIKEYPTKYLRFIVRT